MSLTLETSIDDHSLQLRNLIQALKLMADAIEEKHINEALYGIANAMDTHIEAAEQQLKPKLRTVS